MEFSVERRCSGTATIPSTLFPVCCVIALGFYRVRKRFASFSSVFSTRPRADWTNFCQWRSARGSDANGDRGVYYFYAAE